MWSVDGPSELRPRLRALVLYRVVGPFPLKNNPMKNDYQKAKVTIELEDGQKLTFVAYIRTQERTPFDLPLPDVLRHDGKWRGDKLPDPPKLNFEGTTIGEMTITLP